MKSSLFDQFTKGSIGFGDLIEQYNMVEGFPFYDITKNPTDGDYTVTLAVAGYGKQELDVSMKSGQMVITGVGFKKAKDQESLYSGITAKDFQRKFEVSADLEVDKVNLKAGLLSVKLKHKPTKAGKTIEIQED